MWVTGSPSRRSIKRICTCYTKNKKEVVMSVIGFDRWFTLTIWVHHHMSFKTELKYARRILYTEIRFVPSWYVWILLISFRYTYTLLDFLSRYLFCLLLWFHMCIQMCYTMANVFFTLPCTCVYTKIHMPSRNLQVFPSTNITKN